MLYTFDRLRKLVDKIAPPISRIFKENLVVEGEDFIQKSRKGDVEYRADGIFVKIKGQEFQRYLYKDTYKVSVYGLPKFHFIKCSTIETYGISNYKSASSSTVTIKDRDNGQIHRNCKLKICRNCINEVSKRTNTPRDTAAFFENLDQMQEEEIENQDTDINGYTFNWEEVRANYLQHVGCKCEKCSIEMEGYDTRYIHIHHKNGNKKQNRFSNLEALCILCHSLVDERHIENFQKARMKEQLDEFVEEYKSIIIEINSTSFLLYLSNKTNLNN